MLRTLAKQGGWIRALCVLCIALVCVMGTVQAVHSHADENSATAHHSCTICATAHAGLKITPVPTAPVLATAVLAIVVPEVSPIFRPVATQFIRPPPSSLPAL
jgi:hypothetical protein